ncbi:MAG: VanZ family protein [Terracidiphilus sp.]|jgi:VanZ family protein
MSSKRRGLWYWISAWLPVVLGVIAVAMESTEFMGANHTSGPFRWLFQAIFGPVSDERWELLHILIRKAGHLIGYGVLGLAWLRAWWMTLPHTRFFQLSLLALLGTALVASADEWHQTFLPNRTGSAWDVLLDCCGAITLELAAYIFMRLFRPKRLERAA